MLNPDYPYYQFPSSQTPPNNGGDDPGPSTPPGSDPSTPPGSGDGGNGGGLAGVDANDGGIDVVVGDTDGDGQGLINADTDLPGAIFGDALDGIEIDVASQDSLIDAQVPGIIDATVGDGSDSDLIGGVTDGVAGTGGIGSGIEITALDNGDILDVQAPALLDANVGGGELDGLTDGLGVGGLTDGIGLGDGGNGGITVDALNDDYLAEAHVPDVADVTVGGAELGGILGGLDIGGGDGGLLGGLDIGGGGDGGLVGGLLDVDTSSLTGVLDDVTS